MIEKKASNPPKNVRIRYLPDDNVRTMPNGHIELSIVNRAHRIQTAKYASYKTNEPHKPLSTLSFLGLINTMAN